MQALTTICVTILYISSVASIPLGSGYVTSISALNDAAGEHGSSSLTLPISPDTHLTDIRLRRDAGGPWTHVEISNFYALFFFWMSANWRAFTASQSPGERKACRENVCINYRTYRALPSTHAIWIGFDALSAFFVMNMMDMDPHPDPAAARFCPLHWIDTKPGPEFVAAEIEVAPQLESPSRLGSNISSSLDHTLLATSIPQDAHIFAVVDVVLEEIGPEVISKLFVECFETLYGMPWTSKLQSRTAKILNLGRGRMIIEPIEETVDQSPLTIGEYESGLRKIWDELPVNFEGRIEAVLEVEDNEGARIPFARVQIRSRWEEDVGDGISSNVNNITMKNDPKISENATAAWQDKGMVVSEFK